MRVVAADPHARAELDFASAGQLWDDPGSFMERKWDRSGEEVGQQKIKKKLHTYQCTVSAVRARSADLAPASLAKAK